MQAIAEVVSTTSAGVPRLLYRYRTLDLLGYNAQETVQLLEALRLQQPSEEATNDSQHRAWSNITIRLRQWLSLGFSAGQDSLPTVNPSTSRMPQTDTDDVEMASSSLSFVSSLPLTIGTSNPPTTGSTKNNTEGTSIDGQGDLLSTSSSIFILSFTNSIITSLGQTNVTAPRRTHLGEESSSTWPGTSTQLVTSATVRLTNRTGLDATSLDTQRQFASSSANVQSSRATQHNKKRDLPSAF